MGADGELCCVRITNPFYKSTHRIIGLFRTSGLFKPNVRVPQCRSLIEAIAARYGVPTRGLRLQLHRILTNKKGLAGVSARLAFVCTPWGGPALPLARGQSWAQQGVSCGWRAWWMWQDVTALYWHCFHPDHAHKLTRGRRLLRQCRRHVDRRGVRCGGWAILPKLAGLGLGHTPLQASRRE